MPHIIDDSPETFENDPLIVDKSAGYIVQSADWNAILEQLRYLNAYVHGELAGDLALDGDLTVLGTSAPNRFRLGAAGSALVQADFALSAGWGAGASVAVSPNSKEQNWRITVTAAGTPSANPTVTLTFPGGAYAYAPRALIMRNGGSGGTLNPSWSGSPSTTQLVFTAAGTPVAASTYAYECIMV